MGAEVNSQRHQGVDVDHPSLVSTIKNMVKSGKKIEEIVKVTGAPSEVINKYQHQENNKK